jgi:hypothetical protein
MVVYEGFLITCLAYSSMLKMEAVRSSQALVNLCQTTRSYILEDDIFENVDHLTTLCDLLDYTTSTEMGA